MKNVGKLFAAFVAALAVSGVAAAAPQANHGGLWSNPSEPGWGVAVDQQGETIFAVLLTHGATGEPTWFQMPSLARTFNPFNGEKNVFQGGMYRARSNSPSADGTIFSSDVAVAFVGGAGLTFDPQSESENGIWYDIEGASAYKSIAPYVFGDAAGACDTNAAPNFQGMWWNAPAGSESGWGLYVAHQGDAILAVSLGYDGAGNATWLGMELARTDDNTYSGPVIRTTGAPYDMAFDADLVTRTEVGSVTLAFTDADNGVFASTVDGSDQPTKDITRFVFAESSAECH